jgi:hypothetical protein
MLKIRNSTVSEPKNLAYPPVQFLGSTSLRYVKFVAEFHEDNELLPLYVDIGDCIFPEAGQYSFEIYFSAPGRGEALKGEHPLIVLAH